MPHTFDTAKTCLSCAKNVWRKDSSNEYKLRVGKLLFGTACVESHLIHRRQLGFSPNNVKGGWGLHQLELGSVQDSLKMLSNPVLNLNVHKWLQSVSDLDIDTVSDQDPLELMRSISIHDELSTLFARLHYLRVPKNVPILAFAQAQYWKDHYNTYLGAGTTNKYMYIWNSIGEQPWDLLVNA